MEEDTDAFYVVRKGDVVGVYKSLHDCQAQVSSSVCDPSISVYKGYSLHKETERYLASRGLKDALFSLHVADLKENLFGTLVPCPFQQPSVDKPRKKTAARKRSNEMDAVGSSSMSAEQSKYPRILDPIVAQLINSKHDMHDSQPNIHDGESQSQSQEIDEIDANKLICRNEENEFQGLEEIVELDDIGHTADDVGVQPLDIHPPEGIPHVGMQFCTSEEAYDYYNLFAKRKGFGVRIYSSARGNDGEFKRRCFVCNKEGFKSLQDKREAGRDVKRRKMEEREGCKARLVVNKSKESIWKITVFDDKHNHELLNTPTKIATLRSHNKAHLHPTCKSLVDRFHSCGFGPSEIARLINSTSGDTSMIITPKQCAERIRVRRKNDIGH